MGTNKRIKFLICVDVNGLKIGIYFKKCKSSVAFLVTFYAIIFSIFSLVIRRQCVFRLA